MRFVSGLVSCGKPVYLPPRVMPESGNGAGRLWVFLPLENRRSVGVLVYIAIIVCLALALAFSLLRPAPEWIAFVFFTVLCTVAEVSSVELPQGGSVGVGFAINYATILLFAPFWAGVIAVSAIVLGDVLRRDPPKVTVFDAAQIFLCVATAALVYDWSGGASVDSLVFPADLVPLTIAAITYFILNIVFVAGVIALDKKISFPRIVVHNMRWCIPNYLALAPLGVLAASIYLGPLGMLGVTLLLIPLGLARYSFQQYMRIRDAHLETIQALAAALEAKDSYTKGHSERVAEMAERVARAMGLPEAAVEMIHYAGVLHDIGKIGIRESVLNKSGQLAKEDFKLIRQHPQIGADMLNQVGFLRGVANIIRCHHEWYNGEGYPRGLAGDEIPLGARILGVVDAFDAMTSDRSYRKRRPSEDAVKELLANKGVQFDPEVVDVFVNQVIR